MFNLAVPFSLVVRLYVTPLTSNWTVWLTKGLPSLSTKVASNGLLSLYNFSRPSLVTVGLTVTVVVIVSLLTGLVMFTSCSPAVKFESESEAVPFSSVGTVKVSLSTVNETLVPLANGLPSLSMKVALTSASLP